MALSVNDIIQITDVQAHLSQVFLNVYHYRVTSLDALADYADVAEAFDNTVRQAVLDIQSSGVQHSIISVKNLTNGIDIWDELNVDMGDYPTGDNSPSFVALGFRLIRSNATTRHGQKRIGGTTEDILINNTLSAGGLTLANAVAAAMGAPITRTGTADHDVELEPVIVGRFPKGHAQEGELNLAVINPVQSAQFISVTTQTTRKAGRGI